MTDLLHVGDRPPWPCTLVIRAAYDVDPAGFPALGPLEWEITTSSWQGPGRIGDLIPVAVETTRNGVRVTYTGTAFVASVVGGLVMLSGDGALELRVAA